MFWSSERRVTIRAGGANLEAIYYGPSPAQAPTIVLLHEGLGSAALWRDFPGKLAEASGHGVFAYSRQGYGASDPCELPRPLDYMTREAVDVLPKVLSAIGFERGILLGHSDGASIAAIYAGSIQDRRVCGIGLIAPHFFTEPGGLASIEQARKSYESSDLRARLASHHRDVDNTFRGWNDAWRHPDFVDWNIEDAIAYIRVPVLAIQGKDDQYGTYAQIKTLEDQIYSPLNIEMLDACRHSPFIEQPVKTLAVVSEFVARLSRIEAAEVEIS